MPENPEVKVTLTAEDQGLSSALKQLSESLKGVDRQQQQMATSSARAATQVKANFTSISTAAKQMGDQIKLRIGNIPGLGSLGSVLSVRAYEPIGKFAEEAGGKLDEFLGAAGPAILGFTGALVGLGVAAAAVTHHMIDMAQSIENTAAATGLSTDQVQEFTEVAREMNIDAGSLEMAFARMQSQIGEFAATGSATGSGSQYFVRIMREYGVALTDVDGKQRNVNDVLADFYDKMQNVSDVNKRTALEMAAFGTRGRVIAQMFAQAQREGISYRDMLKEIDASGVVLSEDQVGGLEKTKEGWDKITRSIHGAWTQLGLFITQAATHPLSTAANLAAGGAVGGMLMTNAAAGLGSGAKPAAAGGPPGVPQEVLAANQTAIEKLQQRVALLKAGGEMQLQLQQAEAKYATAVKMHQNDLAKQYAEEIADLKQIIALQAGKKSGKAGRGAAGHGARDEAERRKDYEIGSEAIDASNREMEKKAAKERELQQRAEEADERNARTRLEFQQKILQAEGDTFSAAISKINEEADAYRKAGGTAAEVNKFITEETARASFEDAARTAERGMKSFDVARTGIEIQGRGKGGRGGRSAQEREINTLIEQRLPLLEKQAELELKAAEATGNLDDIARAQQAVAQVQNLKVQSKSLADQMRGGVTESFTTFFDTVGRGTMTVQRSFENLAAGILAALQKVLAQKLIEKILGGAGDSSSSSGGGGLGGGLLGALFGAFGHHARGGFISGPGSSTSDSIPARLSAGEFVVNAAATKSFGAHNLDAINRGVRYAMGGYVSPPSFHPMRFAEGGMVPAPGQERGALDMHIGLDEGLVMRHLSSKAAGRIVLNHLTNNPKAAGKAISRAS